MDSLYQLEIVWILFIQSLTGWLAEPMRLVALLGQEDFFMLVMPALYWSLDAGLGVRMGIMLLLTNQVNLVAKLAFHLPRPYWLDPRINGLASESSFGMPSGHAQTAASIWGLLAVSTRSRWARAALVILIIVIGISRVILGVHFISDMLAGWVIGGLLLWLFLSVEAPMVRWLSRRSLTELVGLAFISALGLIGLAWVSALIFGNVEIPAVWGTNALVDQPAGGPIKPLDIHGAFTVGGTWFGFLAGAAWLYFRRGGFNAEGSPGQRLLRYILGAAGVFILYFVLGQLFPRNDDLISYSLRFFRYTLIGLWVSALAPLVFERIGLTQAPQPEIPPLSVP